MPRPGSSRALFNAKANCASCHSGPAFTDANLRRHTDAEIADLVHYLKSL
jgi:cytochrome c peroxidase